MEADKEKLSKIKGDLEAVDPNNLDDDLQQTKRKRLLETKGKVEEALKISIKGAKCQKNVCVLELLKMEFILISDDIEEASVNVRYTMSKLTEEALSLLKDIENEKLTKTTFALNLKNSILEQLHYLRQVYETGDITITQVKSVSILKEINLPGSYTESGAAGKIFINTLQKLSRNKQIPNQPGFLNRRLGKADAIILQNKIDELLQKHNKKFIFEAFSEFLANQQETNELFIFKQLMKKEISDFNSDMIQTMEEIVTVEESIIKVITGSDVHTFNILKNFQLRQKEIYMQFLLANKDEDDDAARMDTEFAPTPRQEALMAKLVDLLHSAAEKYLIEDLLNYWSNTFPFIDVEVASIYDDNQTAINTLFQSIYNASKHLND